MRLITNATLSRVCAGSGLATHLRTGLQSVQRLVAEYVVGAGKQQQPCSTPAAAPAAVRAASRTSAAEADAGPKLLADLLEAVLGAVVLDSGGGGQGLAAGWACFCTLATAAGMAQELGLQ